MWGCVRIELSTCIARRTGFSESTFTVLTTLFNANIAASSRNRFLVSSLRALALMERSLSMAVAKAFRKRGSRLEIVSATASPKPGKPSKTCAYVATVLCDDFIKVAVRFSTARTLMSFGKCSL